MKAKMYFLKHLAFKLRNGHAYVLDYEDYH